MMASKPAKNFDLKEAFRQLADTFVKNVNVDAAIDLLFSCQVLTGDDVEMLKLPSTPIERARHLLAHLLVGTHPKAFILLRQALLTDYEWIADAIDNIPSSTDSSASANPSNTVLQEESDTDFPSTDKLKKILQQLKEKFVENVDADHIVDSLLQHGVITDKDYYKLSHSQPRQTTKQKTRQLYDILQRSVQPDSFMSFKHSLSEEYAYLADEINNLQLNSKRDRYAGPPKRWTKLKMLGQGGRGLVWLCRDDDKNYELAVKEMYFPEGNGESQKNKFEPTLTEITTLSKLKHPNIVQYYGHKWVDVQLNLFMEYMAGGSLSAFVEQNGALSEVVTRKYTQQILRGLSYIHRKRIIHRDIKGQNILLNGDYTILKIADFGLAKTMADRTRTATVAGRGTECYMSPEILERGLYSEKADIWSFGCAVVEMLTGHPPFHGFSGHVAVAISRGSSPMPENVDDDAKKFLSRCFQKNPADRASALELLDDPFVDDSTFAALLPEVLQTAKNPPVKMPSAVVHIFPGDGCVFGLAMLDRQLFVARSRHVEIYNTTKFAQQQQQQGWFGRSFHRRICQRIDVEGLRGGDDIYICEAVSDLVHCDVNNCIYVSDNNGKAVYKVSPSGVNKRTKWRINGNPQGLSIIKENNLIITCWDNKIVEYKTDGSLVRTVYLPSGVTKPWHSIQLASGQYAGQFLVCHGDGGDSGVSVVRPLVDSPHVVSDCRSVITVRYDSKKISRSLQFNSPYHLAVNKRGFIFVADYHNNRIVVMCPLLDLSRDLIVSVDGGLRRPYRICVDDRTDHLFVGESSGRVLMLNIAECQ